MRKSDGARSSKWLAAAIVTAVTGVTVGVAAAPAGAASLSLFASKTTMSSAMAADGASLTLTVTVANATIPVGLGVSPSGTVTFTDNAQDNLGTVSVPSCLLTACTLQHTVSVTQLASNVTKLTATYSGDVLLSSSSASNAVLYERCAAAGGCFGTLTNGTTSVALGLPVNDAALVTLGGAALPCSAGAGSVVNVAASGTGKALTVALSHSGTAATTYETLDAATAVSGAHTKYRCDASTNAYQGFSSGTTTFTKSSTDFAQYGAVPQLAAGSYAGLHAGLIPDCAYWFAHSPTVPPVCNQVPTTPPVGTDIAFLVLNASSGVSHLAG
ncbi:MAG TPA: hypothetical protein VG650_03575 [Mycobacteriales bacterium]|nr:hypothetical protein [Mycobacteriales bacterium]